MQACWVRSENPRTTIASRTCSRSFDMIGFLISGNIPQHQGNAIGHGTLGPPVKRAALPPPFFRHREAV
jgi:hypothetical protein